MLLPNTGYAETPMMRVQLLRLGVAWADSGRMTFEDMTLVAREYDRQEEQIRSSQPRPTAP